MRRNPGFTLVELLVVLGIMAVLAAILFPVYEGAKENGRQTTCMSNLRQLGTGVRLYADEWNGHYPAARLETGGYGNPKGNWAGCYDVFKKCDPKLGQIYQYVKTVDVYLCPSDRGVKALGIQEEGQPYPLSYSMNNIVDYRTTAEMAMSAGKVGLLIHEDRERIDDGDFYWKGWTDAGEGANRPAKIHNGGTCVLYCDMHAKWQKYESVIQALRDDEWDPLHVKR